MPKGPRIIPGDFGDCELTAVAFDHPDIVVKLFDPSNGAVYSATFSAVSYVLMETNHMQNVVSYIHVFDNVGDALRAPDFAAWLEQRDLLSTIGQIAGNHRLCYVQPIAGADMLIVFEGVSVA